MFDDIEPDVNNSCETLKDDSEKTLPCDSMYECFKQKGLHFLHINTRSLLSKIDEIRIMATKTNAAVIGVTETWLDASVPDQEINIDNYVVLRKDRDRHGGGVCQFIRKDLAFNPQPHLEKDGMESIWTRILLPKTKPFIVGTCYRPPHQNDFYSNLEETFFANSELSESECILLGDFNTNVQSSNKVIGLLKSFKHLCSTFNLSQLIKEPTRVTENSSSVIDLILVSHTEKISQSGVKSCDISDHNLIYCTRKICKGQIGKHNTVNLRCTKNYSSNSFCERLKNAKWSDVLTCNDVNVAWSLFKSMFMNALDEVAPVKQVRLKLRSQPWLDSEILECIRDRDRVLCHYRKAVDPIIRFEYRKQLNKLRNKVQLLVKKAKRCYFQTKIEANKNDSKELWRTLKNLGLPTKASTGSSSSIGLTIDDAVCFDQDKVANKFNSFFTTVASTLVSKLPFGKGIYGKDYVSRYYAGLNVSRDSFSLGKVTENKIRKLLNNISTNKATGLDNLPARFVKDSAQIITSPITHIVNLSITLGIVPDELKMARVVPLYKKNSALDVSNYRPVSILSIISKVVEKAVYEQLEQYLNSKNLLYNLQSGFRRGYSTESCLIYLTDYIKSQLDQSNYTGLVMLDLQKAFDTVDHTVLLQKLEALGADETTVSWFHSYLCGRKQVVNIGEVLSSELGISCGVPQGSILGPLLFLIYVNDMKGALDCNLLLYADDSALLVSGKSILEIENKLGHELNAVCDWLVDNKLSIHLGKTESILFGSKKMLATKPSLNIICNDVPIASKTSVKYLGVDIDQSLSGELVADKVISKANARLKFLYRQAKFLNPHCKKLLASALIQCHFDYACSWWFAGLTKFLKSKLQTTQNKIIRFVLDLDPMSHIGTPVFKQINWLPVKLRVHQIMLNHVHRIVHGQAPDYLTNQFSLISQTHSHNTRASVSNFQTNHIKSYGQNSFGYVAKITWNKLPNPVKGIENLTAFKQQVKNHFFNSMTQNDRSDFVFY